MSLLNIGDKVTIRTKDMYGKENPPKTGTITEYAFIENKMQYLIEYEDGDEDWFEERKLMGTIIRRVET